MQSKTPAQTLGSSERSVGAWRVETIDPLADPEWDSFVSAHPEATVFHTSAWARVLVSTYGHRPHYLRFSHPDGSQMLLPMMEVRSWLTGTRGVCLPFSDECGPLVVGNADASQMLEFLSMTARKCRWKYFELRAGQEHRENVETDEPDYFSHLLDLRRPEAVIFGKFQSAVQRAIRKADRSGLNIQIETNIPAVKEYYRLHIQTRKKHGLPPQPFSFFRNLHGELIGPGRGFVVLALMGGRAIAASVFLQLGHRAIYKFGASDENFQEHRGSNLVMWQGIRHLLRGGTETLDFGRTSKLNRGLRRYKLSWGTAEIPLTYFRHATKRGRRPTRLDRTEGAHNAFFRRMPRWASRLVGTLLYKHLD